MVGLQLIDLEGTVRHSWPASFSSIWPDPQHVQGRLLPENDWDTQIHGAALLPNGDVVFNFDRYGLQRLDRCGELVWKLPYMTHHAVFVSDDGHLWVPGVQYHSKPVPSLPGIVPPFEEDTVLDFRPTARFCANCRCSSCCTLMNSQILFANGRGAIDFGSHEDLLHLNDIEILSQADAAAFPLFEAGESCSRCATSTSSW